MSGATLDSGALIAFERAQRSVVALVARALERGDLLAVPAGVVARVWRDGARQVRLVRLLASELVEVIALDEPPRERSDNCAGSHKAPTWSMSLSCSALGNASQGADQ